MNYAISRPVGRFRALVLLLLLFGVPASVAARQIEVPEPSGQWVTDHGDFLSDQEERLLSMKLSAYADTTSTQIIIVTVPSLGGAAASDYAVELGRRWKVGQQGSDNGAIMLVSRDEREVFIATGFGLEGAIPDAIAARIVRNVIVPAFREGAFYRGLSSAVDALILAARGEFVAEARDEGGEDLTFYVLMFIVILIVVLVLMSSREDSGGGRSTRRGPVIIWGGPGFGGGFGGRSGGFGGGGFGGGGFGGGGFGGFSGGGGGFGGGGAGGSW